MTKSSETTQRKSVSYDNMQNVLNGVSLTRLANADTLNPETPIVIVDSAAKRAPSTAHKGQAASNNTVKGYGDALYTDVFDTQRIDLGFLEAQLRNKSIEDPLPDSLFEPVHKRAERLERSIRNSEKGRAQHEKDQIVRLLEGLQGHDWLRVMGVSGVTESKKKEFEPGRQYFIKGCRSILEKFKSWNLEEKRRKIERDRALAERLEEEEAEEQLRAAAAEVPDSDDEDQDMTMADADQDDSTSDDMNTSQDDDASEGPSPAKQLLQEARASAKIAAAKRKARKQASPTPQPPKQFTSFFSKKHERDGALHRQRRAGRKILAWGHPLPDIPELDFDLPEEYRDDDTMVSRARKKRRDKRQSKG